MKKLFHIMKTLATEHGFNAIKHPRHSYSDARINAEQSEAATRQLANYFTAQCHGQDSETIKKITSDLVARGADINTTYRFKVGYKVVHLPIFYYSIQHPDPVLLNFFETLGADLTQKNSADGEFLFFFKFKRSGAMHHLAILSADSQSEPQVQKKCEEIFEILKPYFPNLNAKDWFGKTPLDYASVNDNVIYRILQQELMASIPPDYKRLPDDTVAMLYENDSATQHLLEKEAESTFGKTEEVRRQSAKSLGRY